ncbi:MAG TPA: hypothetical protein GXX51_01015 [Firmicutes bacterium]|nr:hypothetical protein [Bacillota bacterium]
MAIVVNVSKYTDCAASLIELLMAWGEDVTGDMSRLLQAISELDQAVRDGNLEECRRIIDGLSELRERNTELEEMGIWRSMEELSN